MNEMQNPGIYEINRNSWKNAYRANLKPFSKRGYLYRLHAGDDLLVKKMLLLR